MVGYPNKRARTRAALIRGAMAVLGRDGVDALTVGAVTDAAGVSHGTLYNHVEGLDELLHLVADELVTVLQQGAAELAESSSDPIARVVLGTRQLLSTPRADPVFAAAFVAAMADGGDFPRRVRALVDQTVHHGIATGSFDVPDAAAATDAVVGTVVQTLRSAVRAERNVSGTVTAELCLRLLGVEPEARARALEDHGGTGWATYAAARRQGSERA